MSFPDTPFTYRGGCNCRAIRYRVTVPESSSRPDNPYDHPAPRTKLPMAAICHCNDCRRSHAQPFGFALINKLEWVELSLSPSSEAERFTAPEAGKVASSVTARDEADSLRGPWIDAASVFNNTTGPDETVIKDTWLRFYHSSKGRARGFCGRCGTPWCYFIYGSVEDLPPWWFPQLDLWMGAIDRCDLEKEWFVPDRELWLKYGLSWAGEITRSGHAEGLERSRFQTWK